MSASLVRLSAALAAGAALAAASPAAGALAGPGLPNLGVAAWTLDGVRTPGTQALVHVTVQNTGSDTAHGVRLTAQLPRGFQYVRAVNQEPGHPFDCAASTARALNCSLTGDLAPQTDEHGAARLDVTVAVTSAITTGDTVLPFHATAADSDPADGNAIVRVSKDHDTVAGRIWDDRNRNGLQDAGEPGIAGRTVWLTEDGDDQNSVVNRQTRTDAHGRYTFRGVPITGYGIRIDKSGWDLTLANVPGDETADSDFEPFQAGPDYAYTTAYPTGPNQTLRVDAGLVTPSK